MITCEHAVIRSADPDDAYSLWKMYDPTKPRAFLLGQQREVMIPTVDELREMMGRKDMLQGTFFIVEDRQGTIAGCGLLRGAKLESEFAETVIALADESLYESALADEVFAYFLRTAFVEKKLNKMCAHCLSTEPAYRSFLVRHGFGCDGIQRDMVYTNGRYYDLESYSLFRVNALKEEAGAEHEPATA